MIVRRYQIEQEEDSAPDVPLAEAVRLPDVQLWQAFQAGSQSAYATLYKEYVRLLYRYGLKLLPDKELVMDAIQDLFIELWDSRERLGEVRSIQSYLISAIRRKILYQSSRRRFDAAMPEDESRLPENTPSAEHLLIEKQVRDDALSKLKTALSVLKADQREIIMLKYYGRLSYDEIARITGIDKKAVYNLMARAIRTLRESLYFIAAVVALSLLSGMAVHSSL